MELFVTSSVLRLSTVSRGSCVSLPGGSRVGDLVRDLLTDHGVPCEDFYVTTNGRVPAPEELLVGGSVYHLEPRLCGGKGGFGSMLRALGAQIEKTTNREACRDLSGRRLRDVNHEKEMAEWLKKQAELDGEKEQRRVERLQRKLVEPRHTFTDPEYQRQCHDLSERLEDSVLKGMQASSSGEVSAEAGLGTKRANKHPEAVPRKKKRFWNTVGDLDLQDSDEEDEEEEEEERPGPSHQTRPKRAEPFSTSSHQPGPVSTSPDQPEPISTGPEQSEPVPAGSSQPEPVSTSPEQPEPVSTNPEQPDPVPTGSDQPEPISTGPDQSEPVPTGSSQPEPISTSPEQPETICIDPDQPEPVCTDPGQPETLTRTNEDPQQSAPQQVVQPMDLDSADGPEALEAAGLDQLKEELRARGLKCGGTLKERAARLFSVRGLRPEQVDPLLLAKTTGKKRK